MRLFIAIDLPIFIKSKLEDIINKLKKTNIDAKWVESKNIHITLKFLGETPQEKVEKIKKIIENVSNDYKVLELNLKNFGFFPNETNPKVFFISTDKEDKLRDIAKRLENSLENLGYLKEERFSSHITLARLKSKKNIDTLKKELKNIKVEEKFYIEEIALFKSTLTPLGPIYEKIFKITLKI